MKSEVARLNAVHFDRQDEAEFVEGSPHLNHEGLRQRCFELAERALEETGRPSKNIRVLDLGAGEGVLSLYYLNRGCRVTAVDVSHNLLERLKSKAGEGADRLELVERDVFEVLEAAAKNGKPYHIISACSFLHHVVDYLSLCRAIAECLDPECGTFVSFQDPMRYSTLSPGVHWRQQAAYFQWRLFQGSYLQGLRTRVRRLLGIYRDDLAEDTAEYHVVRDGVDQEAIREMFETEGFDCSILPYWSAHSAGWQRRGEKRGWENYFAVLARRDASDQDRG